MSSSSSVEGGAVSIAWDESITEQYCEGKTIPYLIPGIYEVFSAASGLFIILVSIFGTTQHFVDIPHRLVYAASIVSGLCTIAMHVYPIRALSISSEFALSFVIILTQVAVMEDTGAELLRRNLIIDGSVPVPSKVSVNSTFSRFRMGFLGYEIPESVRRSIAMLTFTLIAGFYLIIGLTLIVFEEELFTFRVVEVYFAGPYYVLGYLGLHYLANTSHSTKQVDRQIMRLKYVTFISGIICLLFRVFDGFGCSEVSVWFFPHVFFHIFQGYTTHCAMVFLIFSRTIKYMANEVSLPEVVWYYCFIPRIHKPVQGRLGFVGSDAGL